MRFLIALLTAILTGINVFYGIITVNSMRIDLITKPSNGGLEGLSLLLILVLIIPVITLVLFFVYYNKFESWNVRGLLFGAVTGLWLIKVVEVLWDFPYYIYLVPLLSMIYGYFFVRRTSKWLYIGGFTIGTVVGFVLSYTIVIVTRWANNSLTSYFHFDFIEQLILLIIVLISAIIGNLVEKKK